MRPVLLRMAGFASFREPATVDFRGADYFALVGPTGSGKSTVIDALTFALYGSVPRWDDRRTVALALAPTTARATVSLVFDAAGERYVVARELRRAASGAVNVKGARLERLVDHDATAEEGEPAEPIAEGSQVSRHVEALLGLGFEDFCTCVVLPQGDFADFLHAAAKDRQEKLEKILGLGVYDRVKQRANQEASAGQQRVELLGEQLERYADATPEAEEQAAARVEALEELDRTVTAAAPGIDAAAAELARQEAVAQRLCEEQGRLRALAVPAAVAELDAAHRRGAAAVREALAAEQDADEADTAARDALAAGPDRTALQRWRAAQDELGATLDGLPGLVEALAAASAALAAASADAATAHVALEDARKARDATREAAASAAAEVNRLAAERELLAVPDGPGGLADLDERRAAAELGARRAARELTAAEEAEARARADAGAAPARAPLEEARRRHGELAALRERRTRAVAARTAAEEAAAAAGAATDAAAARWEQARGRLEALQRADVAATLRPVLAVGEECPVCAQRIATLPPELPVADLHVARHALAAAEEEHDECRGVHGRAASTLAVAVAELERLDGETVRVAELLHEAAGAAGLLGPEPQAGASGGPDRPGSGPGDTADGPAGPGEGPRGRGAVPAVRAVAVEAVDAALVERERADRAVADADTALRAARRARDAAAAQAEAARTAEAEAIERLRAAREPLAPLGAPTLPAGALAGWRQLADWVRAEAAARDEELAAGRSAWVAAEAEQADADGAFAAAEREEERRRRAETRAERAEQETDGHVRLAERRAATLRAELAGAPSPAEIAAELARSSALEQRARTAAAALRAARVARQEAERAVADVARRVTAAWEVLRGARDPLVALGAPALAGDALGPAWEGLVTWAVVAAAARDAGLAEAEAAITRARDERARLAGRLADALAGRGIDPADVVASPGTALVDPRRAALAVTAALGTVRAAHARIAERRADADLLRSDRATALEEQQVARLLGQQLRSDRFPRWLMNSVLDTLVADASEILAELSGGQFALTHDDRGDFQVIDHADADTRRPVKTLSGGETFQASLAMALALSGQLGGLAARSATRLESIFLDEGFGTLDESNLDIVATTLETLAAGGDRMVGVVTHVPALAERVPVRFVLRRDGRTSSIEREER